MIELAYLLERGWASSTGTPERTRGCALSREFMLPIEARDRAEHDAWTARAGAWDRRAAATGDAGAIERACWFLEHQEALTRGGGWPNPPRY